MAETSTTEEEISALEAEKQALMSASTAKVNELVDGLSAEAVRRIESEHDEILNKVEGVMERLVAARAKHHEEIGEARARAAGPGTGGKQTRQIVCSADEIRNLQTIARQTPGGLEFANRLIDAGHDRFEVGRRLIDFMADWSERLDGGPSGSSAVEINPYMGRSIMSSTNQKTFDDPAFRRTCVEDALAYRLGGAATEEASTQLRSLSCGDLAGFLENKDATRGWLGGSNDVFSSRSAGSHTTSDFPIILGSSVGRVLRERIAAQETGASRIVATRTAKDFRPITEAQTSSFPGMEKILESGEINFGTIDESGETYQLASYASGIAISFQALKNDDLGALERAVRDTSFAVVNLKRNTIITQLTAMMSDGLALFHATHGNLAAAGAGPDVSTLGAAMAALSTQKSLDASAPLGLRGRILLVPSSLEVAARQLVTSISPAKTTDANPFASEIEVAVEPALTGNAWYLFATPGSYPTIRFANLEGYDAPKVESEEAFNTLATRWRISWHIGAGAVDYRGAFKNPGA